VNTFRLLESYSFSSSVVYRTRLGSEAEILHLLTSVMENKNWDTPLKRIPKYYVRNEVLHIEEDQTHEFKGHRDISVYEIPPWCINADENIRTRNAISRYRYQEITLFFLLIHFICFVYLKNFYFRILTT
jgi:hypothetical protein